ncbi:Tyrosine-sulfated glycopeptide receptor 1 [Morella rubra]|uniref:Tyrosine-sulfated glycopeptide receptor 1 n=1 Tax=Morella rubra TaxID=262757 RepID=A0A6A1VI46_9ROSI|nr:Tyrosine-sulfated glycopeptide receptor 1 [Morella rubra]
MNLTRLAKLELYYNSIGRKLLDDIGKLSQLEHLLLHENSFIGALSIALMNSTNLIELKLAFNSFDREISKLNFSKLHKLRKIDLLTNDFTGNLPASLYSCKFLKSNPTWSDSKLTNITKAIKILMHCKALKVLFLTRNFLQEAMPTEDSIVGSSGFANLRLLSLLDCQLTGQFPFWLSKLKNLEVMFLQANRITGSIPSWLLTLPWLFILSLDDNLLSGEFPKELCALPTLVSPQPLDNASLDLPIFYKTTESLQFNSLFNLPKGIYVKNNNLSGSIPIKIGHLTHLQVLDLSCNNLSGTLPDQISDLTNIEILNLFANWLTGVIPTSLANLHFLRSFSIASNKLHRPIPSGT